MKLEARKIFGNSILIILSAAILYFCHTMVMQSSSVFIEIRESDAKTLTGLINDNWDGIITLTDEEKRTLVNNLDPKIAGADIRFMRSYILVILYIAFVAVILDRIFAIIKNLKIMRNNKLLQPTAEGSD